ncbi:MAG: carbonic anhydrase [Saprospiraceae bacterium]|jgi:carbonic anhydrase|nr:carbonic anhydrase [Saprospiraceae bacterium]
MTSYDEVFVNNLKFIEEKKRSDKEFFENLSLGQNPDFLYIGCSDSRVTAEEMTGVEPGQMFVHRNIANLVSNNDLSALSVIEYAVDYLQVRHIVVCGHYYCGGVKAAMQSKDLGLLNPWLRNIRDVYRLHQSELESIKDEEVRYKRLVEINVEEQCFNVIKTAVVQKHYLSFGTPTVHGWVFDVHSGRLIDLKIDFVEKLKMIRQIYDLGVS